MTLRISHWIWIVLLLSASVMLYNTSYRVQELQRELNRIESAQAAEQENMHVLDTEWAYLTAPQRLQQLAGKFLRLQPIAAKQIIAEHRLDRMLARRDSATTVAMHGKQQFALAVPRSMDAR